jgi:stearoyl-CoA desaturase (Delta-9 desaturase)
MNEFLLAAAGGLIDLPWWGYILVALGFTHITIASVTIYLHRCQSHRALELHPIPAHFFRLWLWLNTGQVTKEWVGIHRKHHAKCETAEDPHSPVHFGIKKVLLEGAELYRKSSKDKPEIEKYSIGTPNDWVERNVYTPFTFYGPILTLIIDFVLFGTAGISIFAVQMIWIPITAAGIINGIGHYWGYRNYDCEDQSRNIVPWGIIIGGEELHNNHHAFGTSAKLSVKKGEFDLGWVYIRALEIMGLATVKKLPPELIMLPTQHTSDFDNLQAIVTHRYHVAQQSLGMLKQTWKAEVKALKARFEQTGSETDRSNWMALKAAWATLSSDASKLAAEEKARLEVALSNSITLAHVYNLRSELTSLWARSSDSREQLAARWSAWCQHAEGSNIPAMVNFSKQLRRYA